MGVEDHGEYRINLKSSNYDKVAVDINMIVNVLNATAKEIDIDGTFKEIDKLTTALMQMQQDDSQLLEDMATNEETIRKLHVQCEQERLESIKTIEETNQKIQKLRFDVEDVDSECSFS